MESTPDTPTVGRTRGGRLRRLWRVAWRLALAVVAGSVLAVAVFRFVPPPVSGVMVERAVEARLHGRPFHLAYHWAPRRDIAPSLPLAVIAAEDQRFFLHHGWDREAIRDALADAERGRRLRGASTISQQTAKNLFLWSGRSWVRKGLETWYTFWIELLWPKERILEVYLNIAEWDDGVFGAQAACRKHFGQEAGSLDRGRAARLAAVLPNPHRMDAGRPSDYVMRRQGEILAQMNHLEGSPYAAPLDHWRGRR